MTEKESSGHILPGQQAYSRRSTGRSDMVGIRWVQPKAGLYRKPRPNTGKPPNEYEIAIYNSNVTVSTVFWDWRHKVLTLYLSLMTAIGAIVAWLYPKSSHQVYLGLPLVAASGISVMAYWWEKRVRGILDMSIESCAMMEERWCSDGRVKAQNPDDRRRLSAYTRLHAGTKKGEARIFSRTFPILFGALGVGSLVLACLIFANGGT